MEVLNMKFVAKTRKIGNVSLGVIIPYEVVEKLKPKENNIVEFEIIKE